MRGTGYAIAEIMWWLMAAAFIGLLIGWLIRSWSMRGAVDQEWQARVDAQKKRVKNLETDLESRIAAASKLEDELAATTKRLTGLERDFASKVEELRLANERTAHLPAPGNADEDPAQPDVSITGETADPDDGD